MYFFLMLINSLTLFGIHFRQLNAAYIGWNSLTLIVIYLTLRLLALACFAEEEKAISQTSCTLQIRFIFL